jgi:hypothetical protein
MSPLQHEISGENHHSFAGEGSEEERGRSPLSKYIPLSNKKGPEQKDKPV